MATNKNLFAARAMLLGLMLATAALVGCGPPGPNALRSGKNLIDEGRYEAAVAKLSTATDLMPTNALAWNYLGIACQHAGQPERAARVYESALRLNRDLVEVHYNLGCLFLEQNLMERAKSEFTAFILREPKSPAGWLKLGVVQMRTRDLAGAEKDFKESLRLSPDNAEALNNLGVVQWQLNRPREATASFNDALVKRPGYVAAVLNLAVVSQSSAATRQFALQKYKQYLATNPRPANWEAVNIVARQLDAELNPPARPAPAESATAPVAAPVRTVSNNPARVIAAASNPTRPEVSAEPTRSALQPAARPAVDPQPPVTPDVVQLPEAQAVRVGENISSSARNTSVATKVVPVSTPMSSNPVPSTRGSDGRYKYVSPARPASGNRAEADRLIGQAATAQQERRSKDAEGLYRAATQADPSDFDAQTSFAGMASDLGHAPESLLAYETALAINPDSFVARFNFAKALAKANYQQDAAQELERVLAASAPGEAPARLATAHLTLANLYADYFHRPEFARPHYTKVLELDPQNPQATSIRYWLNAHP